MSGYLEVKSNLALNPFKTWKRQWCILRPSPTRAGGGALAVYSSEAGSATGTVELPPGCCVRRAKSRTRPHAFAVFCPDDLRKPRILLAAATYYDAQLWIDKIKHLLTDNNFLDNDILKDSYSVSIGNTELSRKCALSGVEGLMSVAGAGLVISQSAPKITHTVIPWKHVKDVQLSSEGIANGNKTCIITIDSEYEGGGTLRASGPLAGALVRAVAGARAGDGGVRSRSDGDLRPRATDSRLDTGTITRSSWYSGPSDVSLDDTDLIMSKEAKRIPSGQLSRCARAGHLARTMDDTMFDRRSLVSVASGVYEEISEVAGVAGAGGAGGGREEPTYESVAECVYATMRRPARRVPPPPLPPRLPHLPHLGATKLGDSWSSRMNSAEASVEVESGVTRHCSLGSLPRCCSISDGARTLPKPEKPRQSFSVFRKRLKSDSRLATASPKDKDPALETKKKRFDFAPSKDMFRNFRVSKSLMKSLKISPSNLSKGETKSCEFLDERSPSPSPPTRGRGARSEERLEVGVEEEIALEEEGEGEVSTQQEGEDQLPHDVLELILRGREHLAEMRLRQLAEADYTPMSPLSPPAGTLPPPRAHPAAPRPPDTSHYIVMSPRTNITSTTS